MPKLFSSRTGHTSAPAPGQQYTSPAKKRNPRKTQQISVPIGHANRQQLLRDKMNALKVKKPAPVLREGHEDSSMEDAGDTQSDDIGPSATSADQTPGTPQKDATTADTNQSRHDGWSKILAGLLPALLHYEKNSIGAIPTPAGDLRGECCRPGACIPEEREICCLHFDRTCPKKEKYRSKADFKATYPDFKSIQVIGCSCQTIAQVLVQNRLFPTAPKRPSHAIALNLLEFCQALFERSCEAVNGFAGALHSFYERRGFCVVAPDVCCTLMADVPCTKYVSRAHHKAIHFAALLRRRSNGMTAYV